MNKIYHGFSHCSGVYKITNKQNDFVYFGQASQLATRAMQHERKLKQGKHGNCHLQAAWNLYGSDAFEFEVIGVYPDKTERDAAEQALITKFYGKKCYNMAKNVKPQSQYPRKQYKRPKGYKLSEETRAAISAGHKGKKRKPFTPEHCAAISASKKNKLRSPEWGIAHSIKLKAAHAKRRATAVILPEQSAPAI